MVFIEKELKELKSVSLATQYEIDTSFDSSKFIKMRLRVCHDGKNPNGSFFQVDGFEEHKGSIKNIPVLAHVIIDEDGEPQFSGHDMHVEEDITANGDYRVIYDEQPIGVIPENNNYSIDEYNGKKYVFVDCYIWRKYSNYAEYIIERDCQIKLSMEVDVDKYHYDRNIDAYFISDFRYAGITFLGNDKTTGMENAMGDMQFVQHDQLEKLRLMMSELYEEINITFEGEKNNKEENILDEKHAILKKYGMTVDTIDFDIEKLSIEELEAKLAIPTDSYALQGQFIDELLEKLSNEKITADWGDYCRYGYVDCSMDVKQVYAYDYNDGKLYGFEYSVSGDEVSIDFNTKKRKKFDIVDFIEGGAEYFESEIKSLVDTFSDRQNQLDNLTKEFESYKEQYSTSNGDVDVLRKFKAERLSIDHKNAIDDVISEFEDLKDSEDFIAIKSKAYDFEDAEVFRKECYIIRGKTVKPQCFEGKPSKTAKIPIRNQSDTKTAPYGGFFDE